MGYKSTNDRYLIPILKSIDFIDAKGVPTGNYKDFRNKRISKSVMAKAIKAAYTNLFKLYPNAYEKEDTALRDFFSGTTKAGEVVLKLTVDTFRALCKFADFKAVPVEEEAGEKTKELAKVTTQVPTGVTINLNIQLTLPATEDATVYDKIFKALKENLLS